MGNRVLFFQFTPTRAKLQPKPNHASTPLHPPVLGERHPLLYPTAAQSPLSVRFSQLPPKVGSDPLLRPLARPQHRNGAPATGWGSPLTACPPPHPSRLIPGPCCPGRRAPPSPPAALPPSEPLWVSHLAEGPCGCAGPGALAGALPGGSCPPAPGAEGGLASPGEVEGPAAGPGGICPSAPPPSRLASLPMAGRGGGSGSGSCWDGDRLPKRPQRSAACAAISLAPPSPPAPSALGMRPLERERGILVLHHQPLREGACTRRARGPGPMEAGAEFKPAHREHVRDATNGGPPNSFRIRPPSIPPGILTAGARLKRQS